MKKKIQHRDHIKTVIIGDGAVGKTCLLVVYASEDHRFPIEYVPTVFDNYNTTVTVNGKDLILSLWDTAGQEDYDELRPLSYTGADVIIVCFSVVNPTSFSNVKSKWMKEINHYCPNARKILVGTKSDLRDDESVLDELSFENKTPISKAMGKRLAKQVKADNYVECSSFTGYNVKGVFDTAINEVLCPKRKIMGLETCKIF